MKTLLAITLLLSFLSSVSATSPIMPEPMDYQRFDLYDTRGGLDDIEGCYTYSKLTIGDGGFLGNIAKLSSNHQSVKGFYACPAIFKIPVVNIFNISRDYSITNDYCSPITHKGRVVNSSNDNYSSMIVIEDYREVRCRMAFPAHVVVTITKGSKTKKYFYNSFWK